MVDLYFDCEVFFICVYFCLMVVFGVGFVNNNFIGKEV